MMQRDADPVKGAGKAEQPVETELKRGLERDLEKKQDLSEEHFLNVNPLNPLSLAKLVARLPMLFLVITWAAVRLTLLSTGPSPMGSGTESKL